MSYVIVYDRQFIKTTTGITAAILHGDNNVYVTSKKRERDWNCWVLNEPKPEFRSFFNKWLNGSNEHFQINGKWIDDVALVRWVDNGIKNARTIEEILLERPYQLFSCYLVIINEGVSYADPDYRSLELKTYIKTTEDFEEWIRKAKNRINNRKKSECVYIKTEFAGDEPLRLGRRIPLQGRVIAKHHKNYYISKCEDGYWKTASGDIFQAVIFDNIDEARKAVGSGNAITFIDADNALSKAADRIYCIKVYDNAYCYGFLTKTSKSRLNHTSYIENAKKYTKSEANSQISRLEKKCGSRFKFILVDTSEERSDEDV